MTRSLLALALVLPVLAGCDSRHKDAANAAAKYLSEPPPGPDDLPFPLPEGAALDVPRQQVQRAANAFRAIIERREPFAGKDRVFHFTTQASPEALVEYFRPRHDFNPNLGKVVTTDSPCKPPKLGNAADLPGVQDPGYAPKGPCKEAVIQLMDSGVFVTIHRPFPDLKTGEWRDVTGFTAKYKAK